MALNRMPTEQELKAANEAVIYLKGQNALVQADKTKTAEVKKEFTEAVKRAEDGYKQLVDGKVLDTGPKPA